MVKYNPMHLTRAALNISRIIKAVQKPSDGQKIYRKMFHNLLGDASRKQDIFQAIASVESPLLPQFSGRDHTNLAHACAIAEVCPDLEGSLTLYVGIADAILSMRDLSSFDSNSLCDIVWTYTTA